MIKRNLDLKTMNWQDVTMSALARNWDGFEEGNNLPNPIDFETAAYMNAYAYGEIHGNGIDVRCKYADEVVEIYLTNLKIKDIKNELLKKGWWYKCGNDYRMTLIKLHDIVTFDINESGEVGYMTMTITDSYAEKCSHNIEDYYEIAASTLEIDGKTVIVNERNIVDIFQKICSDYIDRTEDAGAGMRNTYLEDGTIIQVYPNNEYHQVWILVYDEDESLEHTDFSIKDFNFNLQIGYLSAYYKALTKQKQTTKLEEKLTPIDKAELEKEFISFCESKDGAKLYKNECGEIIFCTNKGLVYQYFDNNGKTEMPTIQIITYPIPSELYKKGIIYYFIDECLSAGMYKEIKEIADFLSLNDDTKNKIGVPHAYLYGWVWDSGMFDNKATYEKLCLQNVQKQKDCQYLKSIYNMIKDGNHICSDGSVYGDGHTTEEMVGNANQFCTYFMDSNLSLNEFLAQYDDISRKDSLWSKCGEFTQYLVDTYIGKDIDDSKKNELQEYMHAFIIDNGGGYFPQPK